MNLDEAIEGLEKLVAEVRSASLTDDKTRLGSALALRQEARLMNEGVSEFDVIIFGDLNDFKHLNDLHGHDAGDVAINKVGEVIHKLIVEDLSGKAFRQSGDEFVILLNQSKLASLLSIATSLGTIRFSYNRKSLETSISIGYVLNDRKVSFEELLGRAEIACQIAKGKGEDVWIEWTENIKHNPLLRMSGTCRKCGARISCNVPKQNAPPVLKSCPCCSEPL
jgi:diguanylate cyclase (GGDEF)-like protein